MLPIAFMRRDGLLLIVTFAGSILLWWPMIMAISLVTHWWLPLPLIVLGSGLATALSAKRWRQFALVSAFGSCVGTYSGFVIWKPIDGVETAYSGLLIIIAMVTALVLCLFINLAAREVSLPSEKIRRGVWIAFGCCFAIAPIAIALTPPIMKHRVARNDRAAVNRVEALNIAAEKTMDEAGGPKHVCDRNALQRNYSGPIFSEDDWFYITDNYVRRDGYAFRFYCQEKGGYAIQAVPARGAVDGTRRLCADETHKMGCDLGLDGSRVVCKPCRSQ